MSTTASFEETSHRWRVVGKTISAFTGPKFEFRTSRSREERSTAQLLDTKLDPAAAKQHRL